MSPTPSAQEIAPKVIEKRLEKVAEKLKLVAQAKTEEEELEDELLNGPIDTAPPVKESVKTIAQPPMEPPVDSVGERMAQIFGKRAAPSVPPNPSKVKSPKTVANAIVPGSAEDDAEAVPNLPPKSSSDGSSTENETAQIQNAQNPAVASNPNIPPPGDQPPPDRPEVVPMEVDRGDQEWNEDRPDPIDRPQGFPDLGFPDEVPNYPVQPDFFYRNRVPGSTPRSRRLDFERSVRVRPCERDPFTNRISDEDYRRREDDEMKVALGYV